MSPQSYCIGAAYMKERNQTQLLLCRNDWRHWTCIFVYRMQSISVQTMLLY